MLSVILLILKIIGIIIIVLLGILLFLLLIILFVPIRYRVKVEHGDAFILNGGVSWLLHLVHGRISWLDGKRRIWIRIMGILIYDSQRAPRDKRRKAKQDLSDDEDRTDVDRTDVDRTDVDRTDMDSTENIRPSSKSVSDIDIESKNEAVEQSTEEEEHSREAIFTRIYTRIKNKLISFFKAIKNKIIKIIQGFLKVKNKLGLILDFINDDINKRGFHFTYKTLKRLLRHILPRRLRSKLIFGTGDPCSTGQALGIFGILYGIYGNNLQITPDFENKVLIGSHYARGRIRIWTLLIIVIKLLLDKRFKELKMNYQMLKEAL